MRLPDFDHDPTPHLTGQYVWRDPKYVGKAYFPGYHGQFLAVQVAFQAFPRFAAAVERAHHGIDAVKTHATQNERGDLGREAHPAGKTAARSRSAIPDHR